MTKPYRFLVHRIFKEQVELFLDQNISYWNSFVDQCRKACSDPFKAGSPFGRVSHEALRGRIYRLWVGGPSRYRFFYLVDQATETILPIFLSIESRGRINYSKIPWKEYANEIYSDYVQNNASAFEVWRFLYR